MKIRCMAGKGILSKEECLSCALETAPDTPCGYDYTLLKHLYGKERYREKDIHVSDLLGCLRSSYYSKTADPEDVVVDASDRLIVSQGSLQHLALELDAGPDFAAEVIMEDTEMKVVGMADVLIKKPDGTFRIVDYKTTRNIDIRWLPRKEHVMQVNMYAHLFRKQHPDLEITGAAIQYMDFMGPSKCEEHKAFVKYDEEKRALACPICGKTSYTYHRGAVLVPIELMKPEKIEEYMEERSTELNTHLEEKTVPKAETSFLCRYCPFLKKCPAGQVSVFGEDFF